MKSSHYLLSGRFPSEFDPFRNVSKISSAKKWNKKEINKLGHCLNL